VILTGDCIEVMRTLDTDSVDAVVTDPPYGLEFMGKEWDSFRTYAGGNPNMKPQGAAIRATEEGRWQPGRGYGSRQKNPRCRKCGKLSRGNGACKCPVPDLDMRNAESGYQFQYWVEAWGREALRVTKPGGYLLAFGGTRTHHRLVCGLEDAGWIIRDELDWIYASGFPKGKANLKPAHEPIVLARKPGPLRPLAIDECRIPGTWSTWKRADGTINHEQQTASSYAWDGARTESPAGRWPSNVLLSDPDLFDVANPGVVGSGAVTTMPADYRRSVEADGGVTRWNSEQEGSLVPGYGDTGGYSRFFAIPRSNDVQETASGGGEVQADTAGDRPDGEAVGQRSDSSATQGRTPAEREDYPKAFLIPKADRADREPVLRPDGHEAGKRFSTHPTVKPVDLMRHLIRLVTPVGGTVLDCVLGSGTTAVAAEMEGFAWIGIEREPEYVAIAEARLNGVQRGLGLDVPAPTRRDIGKQRGNKDENGNPTLGSNRDDELIWRSYTPEPEEAA
jgi:site-specific DNA-methyltransferase (adenine-specific)